MIDWAEYYVNITEANANPTKDPEWKTLYASVLAEYEMDVSFFYFLYFVLKSLFLFHILRLNINIELQFRILRYF